MVKGYSRTQIALHWAVGLLIVFQLIFGEDMGGAWDAVEDGLAPDMTLLVWGHIVVGSAILALVVWRLALRLTRGVPGAPAGESAALRLAGHLGHWALYALMVATPITGLLAWFGGIAVLAEVHGLAKPALIILILIHVAAAFYHQFKLKDGLLDRMRKPQI
jgi:cytochrome b561